MSLSARVPSTVKTNYFTPTIYAKELWPAVHDNLIAGSVVDRSLEDDGEYGKGDTFNIPFANTVTAQEVVVGSLSSAQNPYNTSGVQLVMDQWYDCPVTIDEMSLLQSQVNLETNAAKEAGEAISVKIDSTVCALFSALNGSSVLGTDGGAYTIDVIDDAIEALMKATKSTNFKDWAFVTNPSGMRDLKNIERFVSKDYGPGLKNGLVGMLDGVIPVHVTNNLSNATTGAYSCLLHKKAITLKVQRKFKPGVADKDELVKFHQIIVNVSALWGVKETRDGFGIPIYTRSR